MKPSFTTFSFAIENLNLEIYNRELEEIKGLLKEEKDIPFKLANDIFHMAISPDYLANDDMSKKSSADLRKTLQYFESLPKNEYKFKGTVATNFYDNGIQLLEPYSLHNLLYLTLFNYRQTAIKGDLQEKDSINQFFYKEIRAYRDAKFSQQDIERLTHYKMCIISAYLTYVVAGYIPVKAKNFTKKDLFQSVKKVLKKFKDEKQYSDLTKSTLKEG